MHHLDQQESPDEVRLDSDHEAERVGTNISPGQVDDTCWGHRAAKASSEQLLALRESVDRLSQLSDRQFGLIDGLRKENDSLRKGELRQALRPLFCDIIRFYDDLVGLSSAWQESFPELPEMVRKGLSSLERAILDILDLQGVTAYQAEIGDSYDRKRHVVTKPISTSDESLHRTINRSTRTGFEWDIGILRPVGVEVYRLEQSLLEAENLQKSEPTAGAEPQAEPQAPDDLDTQDGASSEPESGEDSVGNEPRQDASLSIDESGILELGDTSIAEALKAIGSTSLFDFLGTEPTRDRATVVARYSKLKTSLRLSSESGPDRTERLLLRAVRQLLIERDPSIYVDWLCNRVEPETGVESKMPRGEEKPTN